MMGNDLKPYEMIINFLTKSTGKRIQQFLGFTHRTRSTRQDLNRVAFTEARTRFMFPNEKNSILMEFLGVLTDFKDVDPFYEKELYQQLYMANEVLSPYGVTYEWSYDGNSQDVADFHAAELRACEFSSEIKFYMQRSPSERPESIRGLACCLQTERCFNRTQFYAKALAPVLLVQEEDSESLLVYRPPDIRFEYGKMETIPFE